MPELLNFVIAEKNETREVEVLNLTSPLVVNVPVFEMPPLAVRSPVIVDVPCTVSGPESVSLAVVSEFVVMLVKLPVAPVKLPCTERFCV